MNHTEVETITWRELTGNKFSKGLHPAMTTEQGYIGTRHIRKIGDVTPTLFNVIYNREYLIGHIIKSTCKPLFILGKQKVLDLVSEAWDKQYPHYQDESSDKKEAS